MEKRLILAIAFSVMVIVFFQFLLPKPKANLPTPEKHEESIPPGQIANISRLQEIQTPPAKEKETVIETDKYILTFTNIGGSITGVVLKEYKISGGESPLVLVSGAKGDRAILSVESNGLAQGLADRMFSLTKDEPNTLVYEHDVPGHFRISKEYYIHNSLNYIELRISIQNLSDGQIYKDYNILGGSSLSASSVMGRRFLEIVSLVDGKIIRNAKVKDNQSLVRGIVSWTGLKERYFSIILKPQQESEGVILRQFAKDNMASGVTSRRDLIYPNQSIHDSYVLYIGPNDIATLRATGFGMEQIIDYGMFGGITKILLTILRGSQRVVKNWGVAIIMLTCLINLILLPLTKKSFISMKKIQDVQPHIEKLRQVHKDNPQKLNKELAELYRQYNINPFGGCLPLLMQMPIFIALYQGLMRSIELKGANFLWIKDLSHPDYISLPIKLPFLGNEVHVLPLLMVVAMFFQQKMSSKKMSSASKEQQQQQQVMMIIFPLFFGFLFYNFPSGLVLYWLTNTILMIIENSALQRSLER